MALSIDLSNIKIRPFAAGDYERLAEIENANFPEQHETAEEKRFDDEKRADKFLWGRSVAEDETGRVIGFATYSQGPWMFHPNKFYVSVSVDPTCQRQGIGSLLWDHLQQELAKYEPIALRCHGQVDKLAGINFIAKRCFVEVMREWESRLDVAAFDSTPFAGAEERVTAQGIVLKTYRELESDPDRDRKTYDLDVAISLDMPSSEAASVPTYAEWQARFLKNPNLLPDGVFIAVDTNAHSRYVGISELWKMQGSSDLNTGGTGVLREYRRRGIALALKLRAINYAKENGAPAIRTWNAQCNRAMLSINEALGFEKQPAWVEYVLRTKEETTMIRHATPQDREGIVAVNNAVWSEFPITVEELRRRDEMSSAKMRQDRFVVERDGAIVAVGEYSQKSAMYHPRKFHLHVDVQPEYQGQGIGKALYAHLLAALRPFDPIAFSASTFADRERALRFLKALGFEEAMREQTSRCDPSTFDPAQYVADLERVATQGITIKTFTELKETDPDVYTKMEELHWVLHQDVPHPEPITRPDFDQWMKRFESPRFLADGNLIAVDDATGAFVGTSILWGSSANTDLATGLTGVLPEYRKRGIATALKVRALAYAQQRGAAAVWTSNEVNNTGMLSINFRLGFEKRPEEIAFIKRLSKDAES